MLRDYIDNKDIETAEICSLAQVGWLVTSKSKPIDQTQPRQANKSLVRLKKIGRHFLIISVVACVTFTVLNLYGNKILHADELPKGNQGGKAGIDNKPKPHKGPEFPQKYPGRGTGKVMRNQKRLRNGERCWMPDVLPGKINRFIEQEMGKQGIDGRIRPITSFYGPSKSGAASIYATSLMIGMAFGAIAYVTTETYSLYKRYQRGQFSRKRRR